MQLVLWPAVVTLAITLLRLYGELQGWAPTFFNRSAGGGGALVGISWLPIVLGPYFALRLAKAGKGPTSAWRAAGLALLGLVVAMGGFGLAQGRGVAAILVAFLLSLGLSFLPFRAWPELGRTLLVYGLAARVPVVVVMLLAIYGKWGTHYDALPPDPPPNLVTMGPLGQWFAIGFVPQMTLWIAWTVLVGTLVGAVVVALHKRRA
jgi:hypothetical protein